jgi:hypothetical protein
VPERDFVVCPKTPDGTAGNLTTDAQLAALAVEHQTELEPAARIRRLGTPHAFIGMKLSSEFHTTVVPTRYLP